jgi:hypothetical protein
MIRLLHLVAVGVLIASAIYAYSIKYDTLYQSEQVAKVQGQLRKERDGIAVLRAEWQLLNKPDRLQQAVEKHLDLQRLDVQQLARWSEVPDRPAKSDGIGRKLEALGLFGPTATPKDVRSAADARTPSSTRTPTR